MDKKGDKRAKNRPSGGTADKNNDQMFAFCVRIVRDANGQKQSVRPKSKERLYKIQLIMMDYTLAECYTTFYILRH